MNGVKDEELIRFDKRKTTLFMFYKGQLIRDISRFLEELRDIAYGIIPK